MISDVLHQAIREITEYQEELPVLYDPVAIELNALKDRMWGLILKLNTLPGL